MVLVLFIFSSSSSQAFTVLVGLLLPRLPFSTYLYPRYILMLYPGLIYLNFPFDFPTRAIFFRPFNLQTRFARSSRFKQFYFETTLRLP